MVTLIRMMLWILREVLEFIIGTSQEVFYKEKFENWVDNDLMNYFITKYPILPRKKSVAITDLFDRKTHSIIGGYSKLSNPTGTSGGIKGTFTP